MTPDIRGCSSQLVVQITDLTLNFVNGTNVSLFSPSTNSRVVIPTCLNPTLPVMMQLPLKPWFNNWMIATNHSIDDMRNSLGYYWWNMRYLPEDKPYDGALSITLSSGLEIRIENDQLITPDVTIDKQTGNTVTDSAGPVMLVTSMQEINENDTAQLGFQFFSAAYLQVNQEAEQFSLWKASRTEDEDLVALDAADEEVSEICAGNSTGTSVDNVSNDSTSLPKGAIAGIAVGGAAVVALVVGLVVWFWKKKKKSKDPKVMLPSARSQDHTTHESPYREMLIPAQNSV
ncbi:hypothetical protein K4K59_002093 [Colletotrichum sp. SAR11_240]|nr:hypothetical protein K4K59_002093 [Colletotrichum sp. SAR11_240]